MANTGVSYIKPADHVLRLNTVLHVPNLAMNLLSFTKLCRDNNCFITLDEENIAVQDKASKTILYQGKSSDDGLFRFRSPHFSTIPQLSRPASAFVSASTAYPLWHQRLGHPSHTIMSKMLCSSEIKVPAMSSSHVCTNCLEGKMHRLPFSESVSRSVVPFYKVHSDVWGPAPCLSIEGFRYYVTFIDDCTRFVWIFPLINKSDVLSQFVKFCAFVKTHFDSHIKVFQTDGGGEYNSKAFANFLDSQGILHQCTCPYTPQQNGVAERKNRHVVETAITLMSVASLSKSFWFHSVAHSCFLINRMPCKSLQMLSPYELLFHKPPDLSILKVFGSSCYPYLRPYTHDKLDSRTTKCVFLGYALGYKGVICYSIEQNRLWISRHVVHDETSFPFLACAPPTTSLIDPTTFFPSSSPLTTHFQQMPVTGTIVPLCQLPTDLMGINGSSNVSTHHGSQNTGDRYSPSHDDDLPDLNLGRDTDGRSIVHSQPHSAVNTTGLDAITVAENNSGPGDDYVM